MILLGAFAKGHKKEIAKAQKWIDSAQAQFASAIEEAQIAEQEFDRIASDKMKQADDLIVEANEIASKVKQARNFKQKLMEFVQE